ncbi:response regulator [Propionibacteriaceae bacterium G57]|uniref:response regulator n=1 Tax=Aestuariimicrobium sp. G57 TaxID=3418485 RepID=UPI003DA6CECD
MRPDSLPMTPLRTPDDQARRPISVAIADDHPMISAGFAALLGAQPDMRVVGTAANGRELVSLALRHQPDVAVVDVRMPELDGISATRELLASGVGTRVLILTTFDLDEYVYDALRAGASGFLLKDVTASRLVDAVRLVADGSMLLGPSVTRRLVRDVALTRESTADGRAAATLATLTPRERVVFDLLARGLPNAEIAGELIVSTETVKSHVAEVLRKLGLRDRVQVVVFAYENGVIRPGDE